MTVDHVLLAPTDAWSARGMWCDDTRARVIPLGASSTASRGGIGT